MQSLCGDGSDSSESDGPLLCLTYDSLIELVEHLKACQEIASTRTGERLNESLSERREQQGQVMNERLGQALGRDAE